MNDYTPNSGQHGNDIKILDKNVLTFACTYVDVFRFNLVDIYT